MSHDKPNEEIRELAALYSLGALTQHEAQCFETHIREGCPVCEAEYRRFKHITAEIGLTANEAPPPDYIRELILARVGRQPTVEAPRTEPPLAEAPLAGAPLAGAEKEETAPQNPPAKAPRPVLTQPVRERPSAFPWILAAIFAIVAVWALYTYNSVKGDKAALEDKIASAQTEIADMEALLNIQQNRRGELEEIISTVSKPETRILHLAGKDPAPSSSGAIFWDAQLNKCLIFGYMPPTPSGKTYQLWYMTTSAMIPSGFLKPGPNGRIYGWFSIPPEITNMTMVITLEPESGSKSPSLPYYAIGRND